MVKKLFLISLLLIGFKILAKSPDLSAMSDQDKKLTGIIKLTPEEINSLNQWLSNQQSNLKKQNTKKNIGFKNNSESKTKPVKISAKLEKQYTNSRGQTYYQLDNGQLWRNVSSGSIFIKNNGPKIVTIKPGLLGSWSLKGDGNKSVKVKRIK